MLRSFIKKFVAYMLFGPLFQKEPFSRWIVASIVSPFKVYKKNYKNITFKYNLSSFEVKRFVNLFWLESSREVDTRNWIENNLKKDDVFLNVGAHIGTFVIFVNKLKKLKKTICIEPASSNVAELMVNLNINNINNAIIYHCAAGDRDKFVELTYENLNPGYYNARVLDLHYSKSQYLPKQGSEFVQMKKLDDIFLRDNIPLPNIVLIDIDGHELLALKGMKKIFGNKNVRWAIIETNNYTEKFVIGFMKKNNFKELNVSRENSRVVNRIFLKNYK